MATDSEQAPNGCWEKDAGVLDSPEIPVFQEDLGPPAFPASRSSSVSFENEEKGCESSTAGDQKDEKMKKSEVGRGRDGEDGEKDGGRGEWGNHCEFFLTSLGLAVGLGNIWRFPYVCYENGGGTFLVPYLLCLLLLGLPLFFLEMALGQYSGTSCTKVFCRLAPGLKGLGYGILAVPTMMCLYYTVIMAWALFYLFQGFRSTLPWQSCNSAVLAEYSTANCFTKYDNDFCNEEEETFWNKTCLAKGKFCSQFGFTSHNATHCTFTDNSTAIDIAKVTKRAAASEEFFRRRMLLQTDLGKVDTWENYGPPQWEVIGCLALAWTLVALSLVKGMQSYGKLTYFITLFPYVVLTIFLVMGSFEEGFATGITDFYLKPDWNRLVTDYKVWVAACTQIFFSLGVGIGSQLLLSSYNSFTTNCHRDAWLIAVANSLTSIFAGFVVFGTLGMLAQNNGVSVEDVITGGEGLTFQVYPEAITQMPLAPLFSFLFFVMLCLLAMSSIVGMWEPIVAALLDELPSLRKRRTIVYITSCIFAFLGGLSCCFPSGIFMFGLLNDHTANTILYFGFAEVAVVAWLYGVKNFLQDIRDMSIHMPRFLGYFWTGCWTFITPLLCLVIICIGFATRQLESRDGYVFPPFAQALGWSIELAPVALVAIVSIATILLRLRHNPHHLSFASLFSPSTDWGPREDRPARAIPGCEENLAFYKSVDADSISVGESVRDVTDAGSVALSVEYSVNEKSVEDRQEFDESSSSRVALGDEQINPGSEKDDGNTSESTLEESTEL